MFLTIAVNSCHTAQIFSFFHFLLKLLSFCMWTIQVTFNHLLRVRPFITKQQPVTRNQTNLHTLKKKKNQIYVIKPGCPISPSLYLWPRLHVWQLWCNPLWLTGLKAPTNQLTKLRVWYAFNDYLFAWQPAYSELVYLSCNASMRLLTCSVQQF